MLTMIMMCFLVTKGPLARSAPWGWGQINYDDDIDNDDDDDDDDNNMII